MWVRPMFQDHEVFGEWFTLVPTLRDDEEKFYNYFRMFPKDFDFLLKKVGPFLVKKSKRKSICPGEMLAITLR